MSSVDFAAPRPPLAADGELSIAGQDPAAAQQGRRVQWHDGLLPSAPPPLSLHIVITLEADLSRGSQQIVRTEGFGRLYRGLVPPLMLEAPKRAVKFAANDFWGTTYRQAFGTDKMTQNLSTLTGMTAGATESVVVVPFELVKIRLQDRVRPLLLVEAKASSLTVAAQTSTFTGPMDVVKKTIAADGILGLYGGFESTFWRYVSCSSSLSRLLV